MRVRRLTPAGVGGVALVELVGPGAAEALERLLDRPLPAAGRVRVARLRSPEGEAVDEVLVARAGPDAFELGCHGGPAVVESVVALLSRVGARPTGPSVATAPPGRRIAVEVEAALARATTERGAQVLLGQDAAWAEALEAIRGDPAGARARLEALAATAPLGLGLTTPPRVVLSGPPNAGKSSLLNALLGRARVLVSEQPGTTRDAIEEPIDAAGLPVRLTDTAGLRESGEAIEAEGVRRAERLAAEADARLVVVDLSDPSAGLALARSAPARRLVVGNKLDLAPSAGARPAGLDPPWVAVSARTGAGLDDLRAALRVLLVGSAAGEGAVVFTTRQDGLVRGALRALERGDPLRAQGCLRALRGD